MFHRDPPVDPSSESDCSFCEDTQVTSPVTMVTAQVDPAAVYQVVYDLSGLGTIKPEPGQENVISIELGELHATTLPLCVVCIHDNGPRGQKLPDVGLVVSHLTVFGIFAVRHLEDVGQTSFTGNKTREELNVCCSLPWMTNI